MNVAFIVTYSDCYISHFADIKMKVILVIIRRDPAHPDATKLLSSKHSHRIIVLVKEDVWKVHVTKSLGENDFEHM